MPVPTNLLVKETLAGSRARLQDGDIPAGIWLKLKVWMPSCLIDCWVDVMFLKTASCHVSGTTVGTLKPAVIYLTVQNQSVSLGIIDLTFDDEY